MRKQVGSHGVEGTVLLNLKGGAYTGVGVVLLVDLELDAGWVRGTDPIAAGES